MMHCAWIALTKVPGAPSAQAYILEQSGRHFDPTLVTIMSRCFAAIERLIEEDAAHRAARARDNLRADPAA
jgi:putative two-component system response regulator